VGGSRFEEKDFGEDDLVIELFQLFQQSLGHRQCLPVILRVDLPVMSAVGRMYSARFSSQSDEFNLQALSEEDSFLFPCPRDIIVGHLHLQISGGCWEIVDQGSD
jgi:hypothetical protein